MVLFQTDMNRIKSSQIIFFNLTGVSTLGAYLYRNMNLRPDQISRWHLRRVPDNHDLIEGDKSDSRKKNIINLSIGMMKGIVKYIYISLSDRFNQRLICRSQNMAKKHIMEIFQMVWSCSF